MLSLVDEEDEVMSLRHYLVNVFKTLLSLRAQYQQVDDLRRDLLANQQLGLLTARWSLNSIAKCAG